VLILASIELYLVVYFLFLKSALYSSAVWLCKSSKTVCSLVSKCSSCKALFICGIVNPFTWEFKGAFSALELFLVGFLSVSFLSSLIVICFHMYVCLWRKKSEKNSLRLILLIFLRTIAAIEAATNAVIIRPPVRYSGIVGDGVGSEVAVGEECIVGIGVGVDDINVGAVVGLDVGGWVGFAVGVGVNAGGSVGDALGEGEGEGDGVDEAVAVGAGEGVGVGVTVGVGVGATVGMGVGEGDGVGEGEAKGVAVG